MTAVTDLQPLAEQLGGDSISNSATGSSYPVCEGVLKAVDASRLVDSRGDSANVTPQGEVETADADATAKIEAAVGGEEATCALHGKKRSVAFLQQQSDGRYVCLPPNICKLPRLPNVTSPVRAETDPAGAPPLTTTTTVTCSVHGKNRSARNMIRVGENEWRCQPHMQCRMERGPGRYIGEAGAASHPSSLGRNTSSNFSFGSDPNLDVYLQRSPQTQHFQTTSPVTAVQYSPQHSVIYLAPSSPPVPALGLNQPSGYVGAPGSMMPVGAPTSMTVGGHSYPSLAQSHSNPSLQQPGGHVVQFAQGQPVPLQQSSASQPQYVLLPQSAQNPQQPQGGQLVMGPSPGTVVMTNASGQMYAMQQPGFVSASSPMYSTGSPPQLVASTSQPQLYQVMYTQPVQYRTH